MLNRDVFCAEEIIPPSSCGLREAKNAAFFASLVAGVLLLERDVFRAEEMIPSSCIRETKGVAFFASLVAGVLLLEYLMIEDDIFF